MSVAMQDRMRDAVWTKVVEQCMDIHGEEEVAVQIYNEVFLICEECANRMPQRYKQ